MISLGKCRIKILHDNNPTHNPQGQLLKKKICEIKIELRPGRSGGLSSLVHSHWSRNVEARLSLVESFSSDAGASSLMH